MWFSVPSRIENWKDHFFEPKIVDKCLWSHGTSARVFCQPRELRFVRTEKSNFSEQFHNLGRNLSGAGGWHILHSVLHSPDHIGYAFFVVSQLNSHQVSGRGGAHFYLLVGTDSPTQADMAGNTESQHSKATKYSGDTALPGHGGIINNVDERII